MRSFIYIPKGEQGEALLPMLSHEMKGDFAKAQTLVENVELEADWRTRVLGNLIAQAAQGDAILVFDALNFADSCKQALSILDACLDKGIKIRFVKYNIEFLPVKNASTLKLLALIRAIENDFIAKRQREIAAKRQEYGIVLGRPKGRKNKVLKLDKYKKDITRYLELSISKASIAKLVDCHPQTLYDWIEHHRLSSDK